MATATRTPPAPKPAAPTAAQNHEEALERVWRALADRDGRLNLSAVTDEQLTALRQQVQLGLLPPGFLTVDPKAALNKVNRMELYAQHVRFRQRMGKLRLRRFVPEMAMATLVEMAEEATQQPADNRHLFTGNWLDTSRLTDEKRDAVAAHADYRMQEGIESAVQLHGGMIVGLGRATVEEVRQRALALVEQAVSKLDADTAEDGA